MDLATLVGLHEIWFLSLQRSKRYLQCCERQGQGDLSEVYKKFGDIRTVSFSAWYPHHRDIFENSVPLIVIEDPSPDEYSQWMESMKPQALGMIVNLCESKKVIMRNIGSLITEAQQKMYCSTGLTAKTAPAIFQSELKDGVSNGQLNVFGKLSVADSTLGPADVTLFRLILDVYDAREAENAKPLSLRKRSDVIGEELKVIKKRAPRSKNPSAARHEVLKATVSRYYRWAKEIIKNVEDCRFPIYGKRR